jgi:stearoyl-CoA desaturase (delta-9 desaturase)
VLAGEKSPAEMFLVKLFAVIPALALAAAIPFAWGWGLGWIDVGLAVFFYTLTCLCVTIGFHRYFTHGAFKATRGLRIALAVTGSMAMQGPIIGWVADHRRHHAYADREGDPHSPWLFGTSATALA